MSRTVQFFALTALLMLASMDSPEIQVEGSSDDMFMAEISRIYGFKCALCHGRNGIALLKQHLILKTLKCPLRRELPSSSMVKLLCLLKKTYLTQRP